jgi:two-component system LytT family response regulator
VTIRAWIVDDEPLARQGIRGLLAAVPELEVIGESPDGSHAAGAILRQRPDLVFLDVQMPGLDGFEVLSALDPAQLPAVIFVTAYAEHAMRAFEAHAIDYLLKPFSRERFRKALAYARGQLGREKSGPLDPRLAALLEDLRPGFKKPDRLVFKENGRVIFLRAETIDWVEADGNYVRLHAGNEAHYIRETMAGMEAQLPAEKFMRINRSAIVNLDHVKELQPLFYGDYSVLLQNGTKLTLSRNFRERLERFLQRPA